MARVILVSNRLPVTVQSAEGATTIVPSTGGLATGLRGFHERGESVWIGWPGKTSDLTEASRADLDRRLEDMRLMPVHLSDELVESYYEGFSNGLLWPLFHSMLGEIPPAGHDWESYAAGNERFADVVALHWREGDVIWVHDYQLMALPAMLRERVPRARIGFFLHIPFPPSGTFRTLPARNQVLEGLLGADLIGFHTPAYVRSFLESLVRVLGIETVVDVARYKGREIEIDTFPMGIDALHWARLAKDPEVLAEAAELRASDDCAIFVGIDRLDYTKGIARRLLSFERFLTDHPELHERVRLIQVAVPSRAAVKAYKEVRDQTDALVGRIQGAFATARWSPVRYLYRPLEERGVAALYRAADAMLVTPILDGMNLVAKEFVAARGDEDGVLVLSEFAGAASELAGALHVNPYDIGESADAFARALTMGRDERRARMRVLRERVLARDVRWWSEAFLARLSSPQSGEASAPATPGTPVRLEQAIDRLRSAPERVIVLDYDGTLVPFRERPEDAAPDSELSVLIEALAALPNTHVHVVSGRTRESISAWFGQLPVGLHAEHGLWSRAFPDAEWRRAWAPELPRRDRIAAILEEFASRTPGAQVEYKSSVLAWHWRRADPEFGDSQANELRLHLIELLSNVGVEVIPGDKVIEVRPHGVHKGQILGSALEGTSPETVVLAMGDDRTDEDLFASLPPNGIAVHVGARSSRASLRVADTDQARAFLRALLA